MTLRAVVRGHGAYLPQKIVTNADLAKRVDTSDEWITERTGIRQRHIAAEGEFTSHLGAKAARAALESAGFNPDDIDMVLVATTTPDDTMPSTATKIQHMLGMTRGSAFDINAACSGFIYALATADSFIRSGAARRILVIGAETYSRILNWEDRSTCILFGDGAGALVLEASESAGKSSDRGILFARTYSDGQYHSILNTTGGVSSTRGAGFLTMMGQEVFRHATVKMADAVSEGLAALGLTADETDWVIPHQANIRILQSVSKRLGLDEKKLISTVDKHANTSAASIPLALESAVNEGKIKQGQLLAMPALGAGLTWGACILRW
jgi:3-oxoacyl-[acyl-carrier-protein] synthase-3